jgi:hypothetical protein
VPIDRHLPRRAPDQAEEAEQRGGLPRAVGTDQPEDLPAMQHEGQILERHDLVVVDLSQMKCIERVLGVALLMQDLASLS